MPITLLMMGFGTSLVGLILGRGKFDAGAVQMTAETLSGYAVGLIAIAALYVLQRAFYALADNHTPLIIGVAAVIFHVALNFILMQPWAHVGIALSASTTAILTALALTILLARRLRDLSLRALARYVVRCGLLAAPAAAIAFGLHAWVGLGDSTLLGRTVGVSFAAFGAVVYIALAFATRTRESELLWQAGREMLGRIFKTA